MEHLQLGEVDFYPKLVGWEQVVGFSGFGMIDCWTEDQRKLGEWVHGVVDLVGLAVVDFWLVAHLGHVVVFG